MRQRFAFGNIFVDLFDSMIVDMFFWDIGGAAPTGGGDFSFHCLVMRFLLDIDFF